MAELFGFTIQKSIKDDGGERTFSVPTSDDAGRSEALSLLIVDEAAFIRNCLDIRSPLILVD